MAERQAYDLVLMDLQMPVMDGYAATAELRRRPASAALPIVAMTAHAMAPERARCLAAGMNDVIVKPFEPRELFAVVARWLRPLAVPASLPAEVAGQPPGGVSFELGLHRCLGRRELHHKVLAHFIAHRSGDAGTLRQALVDGRLPDVAALAHDVISTAGAMGAERLSALARALQTTALAGRADDCRALAATYEMELARVVAQVEAFLGQPPADSSPAPAAGEDDRPSVRP
jgi:CheY-like chemotaxis protein